MRAAAHVPRYKLAEFFALASLRHTALADGASAPSGVSVQAPDTYRGEAAAFEAANVAMQSHRRLGDAMEMIRRLVLRLERKGSDSIYSTAWREGYLRAADDAVHMIESTLAAEQFDSTRDRRESRDAEPRMEFSVR
jgi:hypothetical protein